MSPGPMDPSPPEPSRDDRPSDADDLLPLVYDELRALAAESLRHERRGHTLQPTALVHEAYMRLAQLDRIRWKDKTHFLVAGAGAIRRVLVDSARAKNTAKRGGNASRITLSAVDGQGGGTPQHWELDVLALDEALGRLAELDGRKARVVELRYFGGLTIEETARTLDVGTTTVEDDWAFARSWLARQLGEHGGR